MLFHDGHFLAEGKAPVRISHYVDVDEHLSKTSFSHNFVAISDTMSLKRNLLNVSGGFAIEAYHNVVFQENDCKRKSSERLKPLINSCFQDIRLRELTAEEKEQIRAYKDEQKGNVTPSFSFFKFL